MVFQCNQCSYSALRKGTLQDHELSTHSDLRPWPCPQPGCDYRAKLQRRLKRHIRTHDTNAETRRPFPCPAEKCEYRATQQGSLNDHIRAAHTPERPRDFHCPLCPSAFYTNRTQKKHILSHTKERRLKCDKCDFSTQYQTSLKGHVRALHEAKLECSFEGCNSEAVERGVWFCHSCKSNHSDPPDRQIFQCNFPSCTYNTCIGSDLSKHANLRHSRAKHVKCPMCPKLFYGSGALRLHMNHIHTNRWSYKCDECQYVSKCSRSLFKYRQEAHQQTGDTAEEKFKCHSCDYQSTRKYHVSRHERTVHRAENGQSKCPSPACHVHSVQSPLKNRMLENHLENSGGQVNEIPLYSSMPQRIPLVLLGKISLKSV